MAQALDRPTAIATVNGWANWIRADARCTRNGPLCRERTKSVRPTRASNINSIDARHDLLDTSSGAGITVISLLES